MAFFLPPSAVSRPAQRLSATGTRVSRALLLLAGIALSPSAALHAQTLGQAAHPTARIVEKVDTAKMVALAGNTHPMANKQNDMGAVDPSSPMRRMMLTLKHSDEQESALVSLLARQQDKNSTSFHQWLTPAEYGAQFGVSDADIQTITAWLTAQGFSIGNVAAGKNLIEFSGTAGQVKKAFNTEIHKYQVNGVTYQANSSDPSIPAALLPVVRGVVSMYNFPRRPQHAYVGQFSRDKATGKVTQLAATTALAARPSVLGAPALDSPDKPKPGFTFASGTSTYEALGPYDIATIYNLLPLWNAGIDGTGQSVAILQETNIHLDDVRAFRSLFGLPANDPVVVLNGPDPGVTAYDEGEADIDVEYAGAVAKGATIKLIASASTETTAGTDLSAEYAIDNNVSPVTSLSYGECELGLGTAGNAFYNVLWQQGASQGISHFVSSGDSGSASCDDGSTTAAKFGLSVSGMASTPYNTAVGGTDFLGLFYSPSTYFSATNNPTNNSSALGYIPETTWNDDCTNPLYETPAVGYASVSASCNSKGAVITAEGGSGGASNCTINSSGTVAGCSGGYPKPSWQTGLGVPADSHRDIPDVSLMASNGFLGSFYVVCQEDVNTDGNSCNLNAPYADFGGYGGTSISSPEFAGIMALVNQKTNSRQGLANYVFYNLFNQQTTAGTACTSTYANAATSNSATPVLPAAGCIFNDVTFGSNGAACIKGDPNCYTASGATYGVLSTSTTTFNEGFLNTTGFDNAVGLGSVNIANLVNSWASATFVPTTTTLALSSTSFAHGTSVNASIGVTPSSNAAGTPSGNAELLTSTVPTSLGFVALSPNTSGSGSAVVGSYNNLPGGTYSVTAQYAGDGTYAASTSAPVTVTVTPEASSVTGTVLLENESTGATSAVTSAAYGAQIFIAYTVKPASGNGLPTGSVAIKNNGALFNNATLNTNGEADYGTTFLPPGTYSFTGTYSGDSSLNASTSSAATTLTINQSATKTTLTKPTSNIAAGSAETLTASVVGSTSLALGDALGAAPTGTISFYSGGTSGTLLGTVGFTSTTVSTSTGATSSVAKLVTTALPYSTTASMTDAITAVYSGDTNYAASTSTSSNVIVLQGTKTATTSTLSATGTPLTYGASTTLTSTLTYTGSTAPTGTIAFYSDGISLGAAVTLSGTSASINTAAIPGGPHTLTAVYSGDTNFLGSTGALSLTVAAASAPLSLTASGTAANQGATLTFTAKVPYTAAAIPTGTISFTVDGSATGLPIGVNSIYTGGAGAYFNSAALLPGPHTIGAVYTGDKNYAGSSASVNVTISAAPLLVLTVNQPSTIILGAPVTINVLAKTISGGPVPTGSVTYSVDGGATTSVNLSNGTASFTLTGLSILKHTVTVTYSGDSTYTAVTQTLTLNGDVAQTILFRGLANHTLAVTPTVALAARSTSGLPVTYTVTGPATLNGSILTITGTGTISVTASQAGNTSFAAATSVTRSFVAQ